MGNVIESFNDLPNEVKTAGIISVLLFGKKGVAAAAAISLVVDKITSLADITKDLTLIDPGELTNIKSVQDRLALVSDQIKNLRDQAKTPMIVQTIAGLEISVGEGLDIDQQQQLNDLIKERNILLKISNELSFQESDFYTNLNAQLDTNTEKRSKSNKELLAQYNILGDLSKRHGTEAQLALKALREKEKAQKDYYDELERRRQTDAQNAIRAAKEKAEAEKQAQSEIVSATGSALRNLSGLNKEAFRAYQAFQIAQATINAYRAASNALATYPPPFNFIAAAANVAAGMAQVANIRSTSYSGRALGGPVREGRPYLVGEQGPEMIIPGTSGTVVPNKDLGKTVNVNFTINAVDTRGFRALLRNERGTIVNMINQAVTDKGREAVI